MWLYVAWHSHHDDHRSHTRYTNRVVYSCPLLPFSPPPFLSSAQVWKPFQSDLKPVEIALLDEINDVALKNIHHLRFVKAVEELIPSDQLMEMMGDLEEEEEGEEKKEKTGKEGVRSGGGGKGHRRGGGRSESPASSASPTSGTMSGVSAIAKTPKRRLQDHYALEMLTPNHVPALELLNHYKIWRRQRQEPNHANLSFARYLAYNPHLRQDAIAELMASDAVAFQSLVKDNVHNAVKTGAGVRRRGRKEGRKEGGEKGRYAPARFGWCVVTGVFLQPLLLTLRKLRIPTDSGCLFVSPLSLFLSVSPPFPLRTPGSLLASTQAAC